METDQITGWRTTDWPDEVDDALVLAAATSGPLTWNAA